MALYHLHVKNISRGDGRSSVAAAAYRAGETLENAAEERLSKFAGRRDVLGAEIHLPGDAPAWMADRAALWNAVEAIERRKDARLAKEVEFSIPRELPRQTWFAVARSMAAHFTAQGFVVDLAVHDDGTGHNPHVHLMLTTRAVTRDGFGAKLRAADRKSFLKETRTTWQAIANAALEKAGVPVKIDAGSYAARGIDREPGEHRPPDPEARRRRREEAASMARDSDIKRVIDALAADPTAKDRYPHLSQRPDWPPRERQMGAILALSPEAREQKSYWNEVDRLAETSTLSNERTPETAGRDDARDEERSIDDEVNSLAARVLAASLKQGEERRQAFAEGARDYAKLHRSVTRRMVAAGVLKPENVRSWEQVSRAFRDPEFDDRLAEARRLEAKRQEPDRTLRATPAQIAALAKHERDVADQEGFTFVPAPNPTRDAAQSRMIEEYEREEIPASDPLPVAAQTREGPPDPFVHLAAQQPARAGFEAAENRMVEEYQRDDRTPPDPYAWLRQHAPIQPAPERDVEDRAPEHERERER